MKNILIIALTLITFAQANAQTCLAGRQAPPTKEISKATSTVNVSDHATQTPVAVPSEENQTATEATANNNSSLTAKMVGTNDLNLLLLRHGVKRA